MSLSNLSSNQNGGFEFVRLVFVLDFVAVSEDVDAAVDEAGHDHLLPKKKVISNP